MVALASGMLSAGFSYFIGSEKWLYYGIFAVWATFAVYNGQRLIKSGQSAVTPWLSWVRKHEKTIYLGVFAATLLAISSLVVIGKIHLNSFLLLGVAGIISSLYVMRINGQSLRDRAYLKIHLIALAWISVIILFPLLNEKNTINESWLVIGLAHYFYVLGITIPFDIRDLKFDKKSQRTIPQIVGVQGAKIIALSCLVIFFGLMCAMESAFLVNPLFYIAIGTQMLLILFMNERRGDLYCAGWIDGAIALLGWSYFF